MFAAGMLLFCSCKKSERMNTDTLSVSPATAIQFAAGETATKKVTVTAKTDWFASSSAMWLSLFQEGNTLSITPSSLNNGDSERSATIAFAAGNAEIVSVSVTQSVTQVSLSASPTTLSFGANETAAKTVTVTTNAQLWGATSSDTWISYEQEGNRLLIRPSGVNTTSSERSGTVTIRAGNAISISVTVTQGAAVIAHSLSVSPTTISFGATETSTQTATVTTNAPSWNASTTASWLSLSQQGNTLRVTPTGANTSTSQRSATITVTAGNANPVTVQVTQSGTSTSPGLIVTDIVNSTYTATGTPATGVASPAPNSWSGSLTAYYTYSYYSISNWTNLVGYPLWVDFEDGKLYLDLYSVVRTADDIDYYFVVGYLDGTTFTSKPTTYKYEVSYNKATRTLDFTGTIDGRVASVAIRSVNKNTQQSLVYSNTILANAKFVLTPTGTAPAGTKSAPSLGKPGKVMNASEEKTAVTNILLQ